MMKNIFRLLPVALLAFGFLSCNKVQEDKPEHVKLVKTVLVQDIPGSRVQHFSAVLEEGKQMNLAFRVGGPIEKFFVKEGDFVQKNQLIAQMDSRDYEVQKNAIEAQVIQLRAEYKRINELNNRGSATDNDFEKMKAGLTMAEVKLKNAQDQLNDTKLRAPYSGFINKISFKAGEMVNIGMPIGSIINTNALKTEINIPVALFLDKDRITEINCTQENLPGISFPLSLTGSNNKANNNGLYKLYLSYVPEKDSPLVPGMNVQIHIRSNSTDSAFLKIPLEALFENAGKSSVWIVKDSTVSLRPVEISGKTFQGWIAVKSGLQSGDEVVTGGISLLSEGEKVRIVAPVSKTNIGNQQ